MTAALAVGYLASQLTDVAVALYFDLDPAAVQQFVGTSPPAPAAGGDPTS